MTFPGFAGSERTDAALSADFLHILSAKNVESSISSNDSAR